MPHIPVDVEGQPSQGFLSTVTTFDTPNFFMVKYLKLKKSPIQRSVFAYSVHLKCRIF